MGKLTTAQFRFNKHQQIGLADAEHDLDFLFDCFVDSGDLNVIEQCSDPRRILLGRTGSGKTALLKMLIQKKDHVLEIEPEQLSLTYLSNTTMLPFLMEIGVDLDLFFRLLWRHVFTIELLKERYRIRNETDKKTFLDRIYAQFKGDKRKHDAIKYLDDWGKSFWKDTEYRVQEITRNFESKLESSIGVDYKLIKSGIKGANNLSEASKSTICEQAQNVVNQFQIKELFEVVDMLSKEFLDDPKYQIYIVIDRLDEQWIGDQFRFRLIRALIEVVKEFLKVRNSKIIISLRVDLLDRVFRETRTSGFQEEKYRDLFLQITWSDDQLIEVLNRRIDKLIKDRYTSHIVTYDDILPDNINRINIEDYLIEQTLLRPRDIIMFFNNCIRASAEHSSGNPQMTVRVIKVAEAEHSRDRFRSLGDEWTSIYPDLLDVAKILERKRSRFQCKDFTNEEIDNISLRIASKQAGTNLIFDKANECMNDVITSHEFLYFVLRILYRVGIIGLKTVKHKSICWSFRGGELISLADIDENTNISIHPMFWNVLGIRPSDDKKFGSQI